jgi:hypothetical protein
MYTRKINVLYAVAETRRHVTKEGRRIAARGVVQNRQRRKLAVLKKSLI